MQQCPAVRGADQGLLDRDPAEGSGQGDRSDGLRRSPASSSRSRAQLSRPLFTVRQAPTICSTGASALLTRIEAAIMPPPVSWFSSTSQAPRPMTPDWTASRDGIG